MEKQESWNTEEGIRSFDDGGTNRKVSCRPDPGSKRLSMRAWGVSIPKKITNKTSCEDAHFISADHGTIGVADGVGAWAKRGINSGAYARSLMENAREWVDNQPPGKVDPKQALEEAFSSTQVLGSSTACIVTLRDNILKAANVGDSGFVVMRDRHIVYQSPTQRSKFNCPYQLGLSSGYLPKCAQEITFEVQPGDCVVVATDGLFDNLFPKDIEQVINKTQDERDFMPIPKVALRLGLRAKRLSTKREYISPFTVAALNSGNCLEAFKGGKSDDITVVVGCIDHFTFS